MIVVTLTSWIKRIKSVKQVVESIMNNTIQPDRVYLNLSKTEFDGVGLPTDLVEYFNSDDRLIINWVGGENTKSMKKIFPILEYLEEDDIIIDADDDILFPIDLIESRLRDFNYYERKFPITSNKSRCGIGDAKVISAVSLFQKKMLNNWKKYVNDIVIHTYNDDRTYLYILFLNGYIAQSSSKYNDKELVEKYDLKLDDTSMRSSHIYSIGKKYDSIVNDTVQALTGKTISESFNFFKKDRHDCVMVYGKSGVDSKEMTCGDHLEIEYVIASLKKFCPSWVGRIFIVGSEPPEEIKNDVIHIPCDNPYTHCKDANIIHKLRYACENIPDLTDDFLMISDDQIVTKKSSWEDMKPRIVRKYDDWNDTKWTKNRKLDFWHECLYQTLNLFPKNQSAFWEPHIWSPMNKYKFIEMCQKYDYKNNIACISQSLYYNYIKQPIVYDFDKLHLSDSKALKYIKTIETINIGRHLSWSDVAFKQLKFRNFLDDIVGFNDKQPIKTNNAPDKRIKPVKIKQLRDDIAKGNVIKVPTSTGFIWKRVK